MDPSNANNQTPLHDSQTSQQQPYPPVSMPPSTKPKSKTGLWMTFIVVIVVLSLAAIGGIYAWQNKIVKDEQKQLASSRAELAAAQNRYKLLVATVGLPTAKNGGSVDCSKRDSSNTVYSALTPEPVAGYQAYLLSCLGDGPVAPSSQGLQPTTITRAVVFKTNSDGTKTFAYAAGLGDGDPICFSAKILPSNVANDLSEATKVPICKAF